MNIKKISLYEIEIILEKIEENLNKYFFSEYI